MLQNCRRRDKASNYSNCSQVPIYLIITLNLFRHIKNTFSRASFLHFLLRYMNLLMRTQCRMEMNAEEARTNILTATRCYLGFSKRTFLDPPKAHGLLLKVSNTLFLCSAALYIRPFIHNLECCFYYRIIKYSELEGTLKYHRVQLLTLH